MKYENTLKPFLDYVIALLAIIMLFPVILIITILLSIANHGKPFFFQIRPGKNERLFSIIKFKTMNDKRDKEGKLLLDTYRLTSIGKMVRKTSIDEIPQLFNILKGDMSLIGPRPLLPRYLPYYKDSEQIRHNVKPGITGLAQISGRNFLNWDRRLEKDIHYVNNISFKLDLIIAMKTIKHIIISKDVAVNTNLVIKDLNDIRK